MKSHLEHDTAVIRVNGECQLHMRRIVRDRQRLGLPVLLLHGEVETGNIYSHRHGLGLAAFLAMQGYDVYVPDLRARGKSWPSLSKYSSHGYHEIINEDLPAIFKYLAKKNRDLPIYVMTHGMAGPWLLSYLGRYQNQANPVRIAGLIHFGSRRQMTINSWQKKLLMRSYWYELAEKSVSLYGYWNAQKLRIGEQNESARVFHDSRAWAQGEWLDTEDGFDYGEALQTLALPPSLYYVASLSEPYAHVDDVRDWICELPAHDGRLIVLNGKLSGGEEYSQVSMLTRSSAWHEHFNECFEWMQEKEVGMCTSLFENA